MPSGQLPRLAAKKFDYSTGGIASMKAARLVGPKLFEFLETETPVANDGQVLILSLIHI